MIRYPSKKPFVEGEPKPYWYKCNIYCDFIHIDGHQKDRCVWFKHYIQNLIDGGITIEFDNGAIKN